MMTYFQKGFLYHFRRLASILAFLALSSLILVRGALSDPIVVDHTCTDITQIPASAILQAKANLHIGYGHTSHGSQLTTGMSGLVGFVNNGGLGLSLPQDIFNWNSGGSSGALDLSEGGGLTMDVGYYPNWVNDTRAYLDDPANADINVIIWSWCGQASGRTEQSMLDTYLLPMTQLEAEYPHVTFVYMTGHADGTGEEGNLHQRNQQIRSYCIENNKVLFDFYDIECYDPDGNYFGDQHVRDDCSYDGGGNWALEWQTTHSEGVDWYSCSSAHSQPLNANLKAYAAWWLWARLGGWLACVDAPTNVSTTADDTAKEIRIQWESQADNADGFVIQRRKDAGVWDLAFAQVLGGVTTYTDTALAPGSYAYRVVAVVQDNGQGETCQSGPSNTAIGEIRSTEPPAAPQGLSGTVNAQEGTIQLAFTDMSTDETGFYVERSVNGSSWTPSYASLSANTVSFLDQNVPPGDLGYRIIAYNDYGQSTPSNEILLVMPDLPPGPSNLMAVYLPESDRIRLTWTDNAQNETAFGIQRQFDNGAWNDLFAEVAANNTLFEDFDAEGPLTSGTYAYRVVALNSEGASLPSNTASAVVSHDVPNAPHSLTATLNGFDMALSWIDDSDNETAFVLEKRIDAGAFSPLTTLEADTSVYTDENLAPLHTYAYRIKAKNTIGDSAYSNETSVYVAEETQTLVLKQDVEGYSGCRDAYLVSSQPTCNFGGDPYNYVKNDPKINLAIAFDLPEYLTGYTIVSAELTFYCWSVSSWSEGQYLTLFQLLADWNEGSQDGTCEPGSVSWQKRKDDIDWAAPGGTHAAEPLARSVIESSSFYPSFDITSTVQAWVDGTLPNNGVLLKNDTPVITGIKASEYSEYGRPYLTISYTQSQAPCQADQDNDFDVDGKDLAALANHFDQNCLAEVARLFQLLTE